MFDSAFSLTISQSLIGGVFTFLAPCIAVVIIAYILLIIGYRLLFADLEEKYSQMWVYLASSGFLITFLLVFILMQLATNSVLALIQQSKSFFFILGGIILILLGWVLLNGKKYFSYLNKVPSLTILIISSIFLGMVFGLTWTACIGPTLGTILYFLSQKPTFSKGIIHLLVFSIGLGLPFLFISVLLSRILIIIPEKKMITQYSQWGVGILLIIIGILLAFDQLAIISSSLASYGSLELLLHK